MINNSKHRVAKQVRSQETRTSIINAATRLFSRKGFDGTTLKEIAKEAKVHTPLISYYFDSKEQLWYACATKQLDKLIDTFNARVRDLNGMDADIALKFIYRDIFHFTAKNVAFHHLLAHESRPENEGFLEKILKEHVKPVVTHIVSLIEEAQEKGSLVKGDPYRLHYMMLGAITMTIGSATHEYKALTGRDPFSEDELQKQTELLIELFFIN